MPRRKSVRLAPWNYVGYQIYFVTLCVFRREKIFTHPKSCEHLLALLAAECRSRGFGVHAYSLMPDHLHFLAEGTQVTSDLLKLVKSFKIKSARSLGKGEPRVLWQHGFYEHIVRSVEQVESIAWYIWLNPVRKGIVAKAQEYSYSGSFIGRKIPLSWSAPEWRPPWK